MSPFPSGSNPESWVAIDFETASTRASPCAVGLAIVSRGRVVSHESWLIRPPVFEFASFNVALHGIGPEMCRNAVDWPNSLDRLLDLAAGRPLVAHNASFDIGVIRDACDVCDLPWPALDYACTLVLSRQLWPDLTSHSLPFVASYLGLAVEDHHDAAADAVLAAEIGIRALQSESTWFNLAEALRIHLGRVTADSWTACRFKYLPAPVPTEASDGVEITAGHPLYSKTVNFTGELAVRRRDAQQAVVNVGGIAGKSVSRKTDYLVTGFQDLSKLAAGNTKSGKLRKAEELQAKGQSLEIVTESEFVALLSGTDPDEAGGERFV